MTIIYFILILNGNHMNLNFHPLTRNIRKKARPFGSRFSKNLGFKTAALFAELEELVDRHVQNIRDRKENVQRYPHQS